MNVFVFNQNLKLNSIEKYAKLISNDKSIIITTNFLFDNERKYLDKIFSFPEYYTFADFLTDEEMANIDESSFSSKDMPYVKYIDEIRKRKNRIVIKKVLSKFNVDKKYIFSDGLGIDAKEWQKAGFIKLEAEYYYEEKIDRKQVIKQTIKSFLKKIKIFNILKKIYHLLKKPNKYIHIPEEVKVANYKGHKYVFLGSMNRIGYRFEAAFINSEEECEKINRGEYENKDTCTYVTTWHEHWKCDIPDNPKYSVRWSQDGYLPPNYSHKDYFFKPDNVIYYCWDELGTGLFKNQGLPYEMIPFRKKIFLPEPDFPEKIKSILVVASGSGDWTALKNRSDDDILVDAIVKMAKKFPNIQFTYRCHPSWVHPMNVGVNSINRVNEYFEWLALPNLKLSSNIPLMKNGKEYKLSFSRSSLDEDLKNADLVIGEHSISMIDAAFQKIPFFSVNLTKRRNFFIGINNLGFPSCTTHDEIEKTIKEVCTQEFKDKYINAVKKYNLMTEM